MHCGKHPVCKVQQVARSWQGQCGDPWGGLCQCIFPLLAFSPKSLVVLKGFWALACCQCCTQGAQSCCISKRAPPPPAAATSANLPPHHVLPHLCRHAPHWTRINPRATGSERRVCATPGPWARGPLASRYQALRGIAARYTIPYARLLTGYHRWLRMAGLAGGTAALPKGLAGARGLLRIPAAGTRPAAVAAQERHRRQQQQRRRQQQAPGACRACTEG